MYIGIDLGTSGVKALVIDETQNIVGAASSPLVVHRTRPGWSEQNPEDWIAATEAVIDQLAMEHGDALAAVNGIGLSGQMHGATLLDASDKPLRPCILWDDTRSHTQAARLDAHPEVRTLSGNIVFPGFTAPKLLWVEENEPENFTRTKKVLLPKDYLRLWLTGEHVSDMSDAAGTSWLDTGARRWSEALLDAGHMTVEQMPRLVEGTEPSGILRAELAQRWSMGKNVVIAGGAGDNAASAIGMGVLAEGTGFVSLGTSGVLFAANDCYRPNPESAVHAFCHAVPNSWHQMGVILSAAAALNWFSGIVCRTPASLTDALGETLKPPGDVTFLPYLSGERTPHNDAQARGAFIGLAQQSDLRAITQSVLEGVAFALRDNLEALRDTGTNLKRVFAVGGGSKSRYWLETIATVLDLEVVIPREGDIGAAFGAAKLGLIAAQGRDPLDVCTPPFVETVITPRAALQPAFEVAYGRYKGLYPVLTRI